MSRSKVVIAIAFAFLLGSLFYRNHLAEWTVRQYFLSKNIKIQFQVEQLSLSGLSLSHILLDDKVAIEKMNLKLDSFSFDMEDIQSISLQMNVFSLKDVQDILLKIAGPSESQKSMDFAGLKETCQIMESFGLDIQIKEFLVKGRRTPLGLNLSKEAESLDVRFLVKGHLESSPLIESFMFTQLDYDLATKVSCGEKGIGVEVTKYKIVAEDLKISSNPILLKKISLGGESAKIDIHSDDSIDFKIPSDLALGIEKFGKTLFSGRGKVDFLGQTHFSKLSQFNLDLLGRDVRVTKPQDLSIKDLKMSVSKKQKQTYPISGKYEVKGLNYKNEEAKDLLIGLGVDGQFNISEDFYKSSFSMKDDSKVLNIKKAAMSYKPKDDILKINLLNKENWIDLSGEFAELLPGVSKLKLHGDGKLNLSGHWKMVKGKMKGNISFVGRKMNIESKYGSFKDLVVSHNILGFPSFETSTNRAFFSRSLTYGPTLKDVKINYQIISPTKIKIKSFQTEFEGAEIVTETFVLNPKDKTTEDFKVHVKDMSLQKVLKMALADAVTAKGLLEGDMSIHFEGKVPLFKGQFNAGKKGWIRYQKPGQAPRDFKAITANPMDILENYLYDFDYENLSIVFESDEKYQMKMTLRTLGRNPQYLDGKPLKLNINLEQNLLAAFKAMMLTYDLPNRIKDKIENIGTK